MRNTVMGMMQFPSWRIFGISLLFSLGWINNPAQLSNRICNLHNNVLE